MGKKSRARVAAAGTRKDPGRRVAEGKKVDRVEKDKKVGAHAHPEWAPHLNTASEDLTAKLFTLVEVILSVVPVVVIGLFLASKDARVSINSPMSFLRTPRWWLRLSLRACSRLWRTCCT